MKIAVIGTGYVGLVSGVCLASKGHTVICVDRDLGKVEQINRGEPPIYEDGLEELLKANIGLRVRATTDLRAAVLESDLALIAVGTPFDGSAIDISYIRGASREIGAALADRDGYYVVVVKSTVVPGTTEQTVLPELERASGKTAGQDFGVGMNPEFLREGVAIRDFMEPDRIVLGGIDARTHERMGELYAAFEGVDKLFTSPKTAEMIKYAANSMLATLISFSNEIGNLCASLGGIDVVDVQKGFHLDKRLTPLMPDGSRVVPDITTYLEAGCGFGGSCFPKDVKALIAHGKAAGTPMDLLESVIRINEVQPLKLLDLLHRHFDSLEGKKIAVLGLAFKAGTDDMRESPAIPFVNGLISQGARIKAFDPVAEQEARKLFPEGALHYCRTLEETIDGVDAVVLVTRWPEFARLPGLLPADEPPLVIDGRRMLPRDSVARYDGIGL